MSTLLTNSPLIFYAGLGLLGACIGSFLNVVVHRLPIMLRHRWHCQCQEMLHPDSSGNTNKASPDNLIYPRSRCPHCGNLIKAHQNIPLLSYAALKGKCARCKHPISLRYPMVEALTAAVTMLAGFVFGLSIELPFALAFCWLMIALCFIDIETQLLPDSLTFPLLWIGIIANYYSLFTTLESSVFGAIFGYLVLWSVYHLHRLATGKHGMGHGDFKMLAAIGAWVGWELLPIVILLSSISGLLFGLTAILLKRNQYHSPIAFGPFLGCAGWIALFWSDALFLYYYQLMSG